MSNDDLEIALDAVTDEETFVAFLDVLARNREEENQIEKATPSSEWGAGALGWENGSIEAFLGAAAAWATSSKNGTLGGYKDSIQSLEEVCRDYSHGEAL